MSGVANPAFEEELELNSVELGRRGKDRMEKANHIRDEPRHFMTVGQDALGAFLSKHRRALKVCFLVLLNLGVAVYLAFATLYWDNHVGIECGFNWCDGYGMLLLLLAFTYGGMFYFYVAKPLYGRVFSPCCLPLRVIKKRIQSSKHGTTIFQVIFFGIIFAAIIAFLIIDTQDSRKRLRSALGVIIILSLGWLFSKHPGRVNWRTVLCGLILQFAFGLFTLRWEVGRAIFDCISHKIATFLDFAKEGASFIFSAQLVDVGVFAFAVLPVIFYFSFMIQILYYLGVMQWVIMKLGSTLQSIMGTTLCESINSAANIFIGMSESPLLIKPYVSKLTASELHTIMCSGFASVSGTVLAAYIKFGANPAHLITASVMSAPASMCFSKLFYPETEKTLTGSDNIEIEKSTDSGIIDAACKGAMAGIPMVLGIVANIVAFVSFVALANALLGWLGVLVGFEALSVEFILSKVFMPLSWIMGVPWEMCEDVGTLIGLKTVVNEFVAYQKLGEYKEAGRIYGRAEAIATFAICGFSNPGSIGIMISMLSSMAPDRRQVITETIMRAFVAGSAVCFLTASIAGMLTDDNFFAHPAVVNATTSSILNGTMLS